MVRRSTDGSDILVEMSREAILANPSYQLSMLLISGRRRSWAGFFLCHHWFTLLPAGLIAGASVKLDVPINYVLLAIPVAVGYYLIAAHNVARVALELLKRRRFEDLYLIPYYDPLLLVAGLAMAGRYERRRAGAAAAAFAGLALLGAGLIHQPPEPQDLHYMLGGAAGILLSFWLARDASLPHRRRRYIASYNEARPYLLWLERGAGWAVAREMLLLWTGSLALTAVCAVSVFAYPKLAPAVVMALSLIAMLCVWIAERRSLIADKDNARDAIHETIRDAIERQAQAEPR